MKYRFLSGLANLKQTFNERPTSAFGVQDYNSALHAPIPPLYLCVCVFVCLCVRTHASVYSPTGLKGIKAAPLTEVNPRKHSFITMDPSITLSSPSLSILTFTLIHPFVSMHNLFTPCDTSHLIKYCNFSPFTTSHFFFTFLTHQSLLLHSPSVFSFLGHLF